MAAPTGTILGAIRQPSAQTARRWAVIWGVLSLIALAAFIYMLQSDSKGNDRVSTDTMAALFVVSLGALSLFVILFIVAFVRAFGGKSIEIRTDGVIRRKRDETDDIAVRYDEIQKCQLVSQQRTYAGGGLAGMVAAGAMQALGGNRARTSKIREMNRLEALIQFTNNQSIKINQAYRKRPDGFMLIAQAMSDALLPQLLANIDQRKTLQFDNLTVSVDGLYLNKKDAELLPWSQITGVTLGGLSVIIKRQNPKGGRDKQWFHSFAALDGRLLYDVLKKYATLATFEEK